MQLLKTEKEIERIRCEIEIANYVQMFIASSLVLSVFVMAFYSIKP
jgi:hypothetical protein